MYRLGIILLWLSVNSVMADGGTLRLMREVQGWRVSVFTSPSPPRVGVLDVSVLVQDADTGKVLLNRPVRVRAYPLDDPDNLQEASAREELATNKLMQAAHLALDQPGSWRVVVRVEQTDLEFDLHLGTATSLGGPLVPWIGWPFLVVAGWVAVHLWRGATSGRSREDQGASRSMIHVPSSTRR